MSAVSVTFARTFGFARNLFSTGVVTAAFLAAATVALAFRLDAAEGTRETVVSMWAMSVAPFLPALAAFFAMDVWSEERRTGRIDLLLSVPVRERDFVLGKFLGVWTMVTGVFVFHFVATAAVLAYFAPAALSGLRFTSALCAFVVLAFQCALWSSVSVALSALFTRAAAAACVSVALTTALPRGIWAALLWWGPQGRTAFGEMPFDAHVEDVTAGFVSFGTLLGYAAFALLGIFLASKGIASLRFRGKGGRTGRASTLLACVLAVVACVSAMTLVMRFDRSVDIASDGAQTFSPRLLRLLSESSGAITVTSFLPRSDAEFRNVSRFLRALKRESDAQGGAAVVLRYVDPRWDIGAAERFIRLGVRERSIVFEKGRRTVALPLVDFGERGVVAAIQSVALPPQRRDVCWIGGHGESSVSNYDTWGLSDIARELAREGYRNRTLDLSQETAIPSDCALLVVVGATDDFARAELARVDDYLKSGGRLLVLMSPPGQGGLASLLPSWGVRSFVPTLAEANTLSGTDVIVSEFSDHAIASALAGSRLVLEKPLAFASSAVAESGAGADQIGFAPLARVSGVTVAASVERGAGAGSDLAIRPTRIVIVGDATFVLNGQLSARANANRDFFLNAVAYLAGADVVGASGQETALFSSGMDRRTRARLFVVAVGGVPAVVFLTMAFVAWRRRRRSRT